jgi:hypothetical protein
MNIIAMEAERYEGEVKAQLGNRNSLCTTPEMMSNRAIKE